MGNNESPPPHLSHLQLLVLISYPLLSHHPQVPGRTKLYMLNEDSLGKHLGQLGGLLAGLTYLNLHNCALRKIESLSALRDLKVG